MKLAEPVKLELCRILQHLCDLQLRHRIESIIAFSDDFVGRCQNVSTFKPVLCGHSKKDKIKVLKTIGSLMKVISIAECSLGAFCNTLTCIKQKSVLKTGFYYSFGVAA